MIPEWNISPEKGINKQMLFKIYVNYWIKNNIVSWGKINSHVNGLQQIGHMEFTTSQTTMLLLPVQFNDTGYIESIFSG